MKHAFKTIAQTAFAAALLASMTVPAAAASYTAPAPKDALPAGTLIYYEDFDGISAADTDAALKAVNWSKSEGFKEFTAQLSATDGYLHIDNLDATVGASNDSYAWVLDNEYCEEFVKHPYTYQYDATLLDAENDYRYLSVLLNYDGMNNYNTVDVRMRGIGYNQYREGDAWVHYDETVSDSGEGAICKLLYGVDCVEGDYAMQNRTFTVKVEVDPEQGCTVFIDGIRFTDMDMMDNSHWKDMCAYGNAVCFKTSTKLLANFDNFMIWSGTGVSPDLSVLAPAEEAPAEEPAIGAAEAEAPAAAAPAAAPKTADAGIAASAALLALAAAVVCKKRKH